MTNAVMLSSILDQCAVEGVQVTLANGQLTITGQQAALDEWRPLLRDLKAGLLKVLEQRTASFRRRVAMLSAHGLSDGEARTLAQRLQERDAVGDERRVCLECRHITGTVTARRCSQWTGAGLSGSQLPRELPTVLQRCKGFNLAPAVTSQRPSGHAHAMPAQHLEGAIQ